MNIPAAIVLTNIMIVEANSARRLGEEEARNMYIGLARKLLEPYLEKHPTYRKLYEALV